MPTRLSSRIVLALCVATMPCVLSGQALGQAGAQPAPAQTTPPAQAQAPVQMAPDTENPYLRLVKRREWTLQAQITLQNRRGVWLGLDTVRGSQGETFRFDALSMIFPVVRSSASSVWREGSSEGTLFVETRKADTTTTLIGPFHAGAVYARYDSGPGTAYSVRLVHRHEVTSWDTVFNELDALRVPWPEGPWPDEALSTFGPQSYVNPNTDPEEPVRRLLELWTKNEDPKSIPPVLLAKWLAGSVQEYVQLQGDGVSREYRVRGDALGSGVVTGVIEGVELKGAAPTAVLQRGSTHDMVCLLAAVYRAAGLPARTVIGIDDDPERRSREVRSWVEFCLYDEDKGLTTWIPVDIARLRARSSRMQALDRPWEYFGTHDELHRVAPFAFHFIPPVDVRSYNSPAFYGWRQMPSNPPYAAQRIDLDISRTVQRGAPTP